MDREIRAAAPGEWLCHGRAQFQLQLEDDNQSVKTVLVPTYINYQNSEIRNSDSDFSTGTPFFFSDVFPTEFSGIPESEAEIPIPDPPARGAVPAEFPTKL